MAAFLYHEDQSLFIDSTINVVPAPHQPGNLTMASSYSSPPLYYPNSYYSPDATTITEFSTDDLRTTHESISSFNSTIQAKVTSSDHNCVQSMDNKRKNSKHLGVFPSSSAISNDLKEGRRKKQKKNSSSNGKKEAEILSKSNVGKEKQQQQQQKPPTTDYIHVRARRGQATDSHSLAERVRRVKISERMKLLQGLVPGCEKVIGKALMLDEIINYVQSLQHQVEFLSMKLASVSPTLLEFGLYLDDHYFVQPQKVDSMSAPVPSVEQTGHIQPTVFVETTDNNCSMVDSSVSFLLDGHGPTTTAFSQEQGNLAAVHDVVDLRQFQLNNIMGSFQ